MDKIDKEKIELLHQNGFDIVGQINDLVNANLNQLNGPNIQNHVPNVRKRDEDESENEPLNKRMKKMTPTDSVIKKYVNEILDEMKDDLDKISLKDVRERVNLMYRSTGQTKDLIEKTVDLYLNKLQPTSVVSKQAGLAKEAEATSGKSVVQLIQISNAVNKHASYCDQSGYVYSRKSGEGSTIYLRCKNQRHYGGCKASVIVRDGNFEEAVVKRMHNHEQEQKYLDRAKFNKKLEQICKAEPFMTGRHCYQKAKVELKGEIDRKNIPSLKSFESLIHRAQKIDVPPLPSTIAELEKLINDSKYAKRYTHDDRGQLFFRGVWRGATGDNVAFISKSTLEEVRRLKTLILLVDGTFKVLPLHLKFRQLYIVNVIIKNRCYPLAHILMEKKDAKSYELIFNKLKAIIKKSFTKVQCMSDYEAATRKAFKKVFPTAEIFGCYFHYVQAITKNFKRFGLKKDNKFKVAMQKISALALLPNDFVVAGFDSIAKHFKKSKRFARFEDYWRKQWAEANISVYGLPHRTNNYAESLNKTINLLIGNKHPHIWRLIHNLKLVEMDKSDELERVVLGEIIKKRRNKAMTTLNKKIIAATKLFDDDPNVEEFLKNVTFNENLQSYFKERIYIEGIDEEFDELINDDEEEDEEIVPNDVREETNFRKNFPRKCAKH